MQLPPDVWLVILEQANISFCRQRRCAVANSPLRQLILVEKNVEEEPGWYPSRGPHGSARWRDFTVSSRKGAAYVGRYEGHDIELPRLLALRSVCKLWRSLVSRLLRDLQMWDVSIDDIDLKNAQGIDFIGNLNVIADEHWPARSQDRLRYAKLIDDEQLRRREAQSRRFQDAKTKGFPELRRLFDSIQAVKELAVAFADPTEWRWRPSTSRRPYDLEGIMAASHTIRDSLPGPTFQNLVELDLDVPSTFFVGELTASMSKEARSRLKRLRLEFVDRTGPGGDYWPPFAGQAREDPSAVQIAYPNQDHQDVVWEFVGSCKNLESLCIIASHVLDLDRLRWEPGIDHTGLTHIYLERLRTSISTLKKLTRASPRASRESATRNVFLHCIEIVSEGGYWQDLFQHFRDSCPDLEYLYATELHYSLDHSSWAPKRDIGPQIYDIWSNYDGELKAIRDLQKDLREKYPDYPDKPIDFEVVSPRSDLDEMEEELVE
ncbi:hypothetical protein CkaCkLH20_07196 [Colletotrichum karsti]|uniref:Uncharacterized protein n=1 Tax=Colletotrichum karsti TaxID=1095194 RepID=A0A9P6I7G2_9PEZI|nr:uncharacterized protein CkaCkLH20_07196 [Colletotrichum karsti]KAF9875376.1 hypothetical protein CkaCkLH20_07196 [Colletotrichum karsti]